MASLDNEHYRERPYAGRSDERRARIRSSKMARARQTHRGAVARHQNAAKRPVPALFDSTRSIERKKQLSKPSKIVIDPSQFPSGGGGIYQPSETAFFPSRQFLRSCQTQSYNARARHDNDGEE